MAAFLTKLLFLINAKLPPRKNAAISECILNRIEITIFDICYETLFLIHNILCPNQI